LTRFGCDLLFSMKVLRDNSAVSHRTDVDGGAQNAFAPEMPVAPGDVLATLEKHLLLDGFRIVVDLQRSRGCRLIDRASGREFLDFYGFFGSMPIGFNHPWFEQAGVQEDLVAASKVKVANSDVYSVAAATFVRTFHRVMGLPPLDRYFFIEGGALGVENAIKAAMDWKVRRNLVAGRGPVGTEILHFERAFHGRSGYTLSLTNTDPRKTDLFAKFPWPRLPAPAIQFALPEPQRTSDVAAREKQCEVRLREILDTRANEIAAIIIEPIQGEGGDNHFRGEWLATLRRVSDEYGVLLIFDEVQTGGGTTGRNWCCEHFGVLPDLLAFGKKAQVCGVMAGPRLDEVPKNCFRLPGRINSTWGGSLVDMVRATHILQIIEREKLVDNAHDMGCVFLEGLRALAADEPLISSPRGRGLMAAFDLPDKSKREQFYNGLFETGLLALRCGDRSIRFRPALDVGAADIQEALTLLRKQCRSLRAAGGSVPNPSPATMPDPTKTLNPA
jgi:L-lysine 6-transaminase